MNHRATAYFLTGFLLLLGSALQAQPRIDSMSVDEIRSQLLIYGNFSSEIGSVTIDGAPQEVIRWMPEWIRCRLPRNGVGSGGPVRVISNGMASNSSLISELSFDATILTEANANGVIAKETVQHHLRIRSALQTVNGSKPRSEFQAIGDSDSRWNMHLYTTGRYETESCGFDTNYHWGDSSMIEGVTAYGLVDLASHQISMIAKVKGDINVDWGYSRRLPPDYTQTEHRSGVNVIQVRSSIGMQIPLNVKGEVITFDTVIHYEGGCGGRDPLIGKLKIDKVVSRFLPPLTPAKVERVPVPEGISISQVEKSIVVESSRVPADIRFYDVLGRTVFHCVVHGHQILDRSDTGSPLFYVLELDGHRYFGKIL